MMRGWRDPEVHDTCRDMVVLTLNVAAESFLGMQLDDDRREILLRSLSIVLDEFIVLANQCFLVRNG